ncbi:hypothetical protein [Streptomyces rapamycinicus]|uniref:Uncharacterized protein n=2 Tax=Streptomyces rapamycinicus TaxID=1226757 RepID=A0A0A0NDC0_STRRN|nr:hypothetical protein [Streptomyces rapamycinicus]AGP52405.1 hypothetical protein M271_03875 [Streptomyces rapamycinicus NRRL 5491]MBB4779873.1 hypothetical protein [Streptomyces rapamycinicus]RLV75472.1 hypothetical protein D3C57_139640 [Streptomyces rapamycinicus NRRL 5491]UTP28585.1 hypothetical protein LIV37_04020 [Streptomyces rapamycinicus NRRL 5491]
MSGTARPGDPDPGTADREAVDPETADREAADPAPAEPEGGDPACWLERVCADCGAIQDTAHFARCARCGAPRE